MELMNARLTYAPPPRPRLVTSRASTPARNASARPRYLKRALQVAVSLVFLVALYYAADWRSVLGVLGAINGLLFAQAMWLFLPQTIVAALRWQGLVGFFSRIGLLESVRQILVSSAWNLIAPSKLGDFSKVALVPNLDGPAWGRLSLLVGAEKLADLLALGCWALAGWLGGAWLLAALSVAWFAAVRWTQPRSVFHLLAPYALVLWGLHLLQIHLLLLAAGVPVPIDESLARVPLAILAGLLPLGAMGIGPRDAALVWLFSDYAPAATLAAVGLLTALRYLVPGAAGILCCLAAPAAVQSAQAE